MFLSEKAINVFIRKYIMSDHAYARSSGSFAVSLFARNSALAVASIYE